MITLHPCGLKASVICDQCGKTMETNAIKMLFAKLPAGWWQSGQHGYIACGVICAHLVADKVAARGQAR